jgi:hypothetical protein
MKKFTIIIPVIVALGASLFASAHPDALERISEDFGFASLAKQNPSFFEDYQVAFINNDFLSTFVAAIFGLVLIFVFYKAIAIIVVRFSKHNV